MSQESCYDMHNARGQASEIPPARRPRLPGARRLAACLAALPVGLRNDYSGPRGLADPVSAPPFRPGLTQPDSGHRRPRRTAPGAPPERRRAGGPLRESGIRLPAAGSEEPPARPRRDDPPGRRSSPAPGCGTLRHDREARTILRPAVTEKTAWPGNGRRETVNERPSAYRLPSSVRLVKAFRRISSRPDVSPRRPAVSPDRL
jgi:hypothetical protein